MRVLLVEDQHDVAELVGRALERDGHRVTVATSASEASAHLEREVFDAAILDLGLPDEHGLDWCRRIREEGVTVPILVLTAQAAVATRVKGLDAGADDFLPKPFAVAELRARIRALGRRGPMVRAGHLKIGDAELDFATRRARVAGREVPLTAREWSVVELVSSRAGRVVARADILDAIWGDASEAADASLEVIVGRIRKKLGTNVIRTIRGEGYASG